MWWEIRKERGSTQLRQPPIRPRVSCQNPAPPGDQLYLTYYTKMWGAGRRGESFMWESLSDFFPPFLGGERVNHLGEISLAAAVLEQWCLELSCWGAVGELSDWLMSQREGGERRRGCRLDVHYTKIQAFICHKGEYSSTTTKTKLRRFFHNSIQKDPLAFDFNYVYLDKSTDLL